ncbi:GTP cyclohydrolase II [Orbilia blumenaviensis]|uniref:GTP cyclohydrolase II n=1 Tax=Orbilia blumenaviensis TaxID=1796055 RepID=A0AAV9U3Q2_9PEZI
MAPQINDELAVPAPASVTVTPQTQSSTKSPSNSPGPRGSSSSRVDVPPCLLSPAFTPPSTPGTGTPRPATEPTTSSTSDPDTVVQPTLLEELPEVKCQVRARIPRNGGGEIFLHLYNNNIDNKEHLAIVFGDSIRSKSLDAPQENETEMVRMTRGAYTGRLYPGRTSSSTLSSSLDPGTPVSQHPEDPIPLVRIHSECYTGETAWSARCDCGEQLDEAARLMTLEGNGVVVYLRQEGRGIGLAEKLKAYNLQDLGNDTVTANLLLRHPADARSYGLATAILQDLGLSTIRLLTNNPIKVAAVEGPNKEIRVAERVPMVPLAWKGLKGGVSGEEVDNYLKTKIHRMGHLLPDLGL